MHHIQALNRRPPDVDLPDYIRSLPDAALRRAWISLIVDQAATEGFSVPTLDSALKAVHDRLIDNQDRTPTPATKGRRGHVITAVRDVLTTDPITIADLARNLDMEHGSVYGALKFLKRQGEADIIRTTNGRITTRKTRPA